MMEMKAEEDEHQNPLLSNRCESAVRGNRISSIDYDIQPAINCNMRWGFSRTAEWLSPISSLFSLSRNDWLWSSTTFLNGKRRLTSVVWWCCSFFPCVSLIRQGHSLLIGLNQRSFKFYILCKNSVWVRNLFICLTSLSRCSTHPFIFFKKKKEFVASVILFYLGLSRD